MRGNADWNLTRDDGWPLGIGALESMAFQSRDVLVAMEQAAGVPVGKLKGRWRCQRERSADAIPS